jgi:uncharacterized membrane protein
MSGRLKGKKAKRSKVNAIKRRQGIYNGVRITGIKIN